MNVLIYFLHAILGPEHTILLKTIIDRSFRNCCQGRSFLTEHEILALWRHIRRFFSHAQIGVKAIFTSE